jgi:mono/diheme cytochrome c family protein
MPGAGDGFDAFRLLVPVRLREGDVSMKRIASIAVLAAVIALPALAIAQDIEKGKALYAANKCQSCHAIEGKGNKKYPLDGVGKKLSAEEISNWITDPKAMEANLAEKPKIHMKAYKLADEDLKALVGYMQSLK